MMKPNSLRDKRTITVVMIYKHFAVSLFSINEVRFPTSLQQIDHSILAQNAKYCIHCRVAFVNGTIRAFVSGCQPQEFSYIQC